MCSLTISEGNIVNAYSSADKFDETMWLIFPYLLNFVQR